MGIVGIEFHCFFESIVSTDCRWLAVVPSAASREMHTQVSLTVKSGSFPPPALGPVWLDFCHFLRILKGMLPVLLGGICTGPVRIEDVICGLEFNRLCELVAVSSISSEAAASSPQWGSIHCLVELFLGKELVSFCFESVRHVWRI